MLARSYVLPFYRTPGRAKAARDAIAKLRSRAEQRVLQERMVHVVASLSTLPYDVADAYYSLLMRPHAYPPWLSAGSVGYLEREVFSLAAVHEALASHVQNVAIGHSPDRRASDEARPVVAP